MRIINLALVLVCAAAIAGIALGDEPATAPMTEPSMGPSSNPTVTIDNFSYSPKELTIRAGTTVTWVNQDDVPHTATADGDSPLFDSKALDTDDKYSFTFNQAGEIPLLLQSAPAHARLGHR